MSNYKPIDLSKEDFRKYLDRQGVLDAVTKVLVKCNTERPENPLKFLAENLNDTYGNLKSQLFEAQQEIERLKRELSALKAEDKTVKASSTLSVPVVKQETEIDTAATTNGGGAVVELKKEADDSVGESAECATVTVKQERDAVMLSTSAEGTVDGKPKVTPASSSSNDTVQETAGAAPSAAPPNDAAEAKEPSTSESSK